MSQPLTLETISGLLAVSVCWGLTNPFIKRGAQGIEYVQDKHKGASTIRLTFEETYYLLSRLSYVLPLVLNLCGSVCFYWMLGHTDLTITVPVVNSLTLAFTLIGGYLLGEQLTLKQLGGFLLISVGVVLCVGSK